MRGIFVTALVASCSLSPAYAQEDIACAPRAQAQQVMKEKYQEVPQVMGIDSFGNIIEFYGNSDTGTFTVLLTDQDGISCMVSYGVDFYRNPLPNV